jgi:hypothetical protein
LPKDKLRIFIPINAKRDHQLQISLFKHGVPAPIMKSRWTIKKGWWQTYSDPFDFSSVPDPSGSWKAEIIIDKQVLGIKEFEVSPGL